MTRSTEDSVKPTAAKSKVKEKFRHKLKNHMEIQSISQTRMEELSGVDQKVISNILNKPTSRPTFENVVRLARALNLPIEYFANDEMEEPPPDTKMSQEEVRVMKAAASVGLEESEWLLKAVKGVPFEAVKKALLADKLVSAAGTVHAKDR